MANDIVAIKAQLAQDAETYAKQAQAVSNGSFISTRGGVLKVGGEELPGNQLACYVLDSMYENTFYADKYDADNPLPPTCYAFGRDRSEMEPHETMQADLDFFKPQHERCKGCPLNEFGTADKGRGKACQNRERLMLIPAGMYEKVKGSRDFQLMLLEDPQALAEVEAMYLKLPVTSVKTYDKYVKSVAAAVGYPPYAVVTRIFTVPDAGDQYHIEFELVEKASDDVLAALSVRHAEAMDKIEAGYQPPDKKEEKPGKAKAAGLRGLRAAK